MPLGKSVKSVLSRFLDAGDDDDVAMPRSNVQESLQELETVKPGYCIECQDQPSELFCEQCQDVMCQVCFDALHRRGTRTKHTTTKAINPAAVEDDVEMEPAVATVSTSGLTLGQQTAPEDEDKAGGNIAQSLEYEATYREGVTGMTGKAKGINPEELQQRGEWLLERSKFFPLRLTLRERKSMRLVSNALDVSEYTDRVDIISWSSKNGRIRKQLQELCAILCGLVLASDYKEGQRLLADREFDENEAFFQEVFEITRRHKIRNPEKLRSVYGKLVHVLMDAQSPEIQQVMGFSVVSPLSTVHSFLKEHDLLELLRDEYALIMDATAEIDGIGKARRRIDQEIRAKEKAFKLLIEKCRRKAPSLPKEALENCFRSIGDNHGYLRCNRDPVDRLLEHLKQHFHSSKVRPEYKLEIRAGKEGARLSHSHDVQYHYVLQSMTLWREILNEMFQLWYLAEMDLFDEQNAYNLRNTGQGLQRVQACPRVSRAMRSILHRVHKQVGSWVGSSVIHLGDRAVPNALLFVDKYNQVADILTPIDTTIRRIPELLKETPSLKQWVETTFESEENLKLEILCDFFRHGFDGSGADNFYDAGSCIDGRLTSAWNWCQNISKRRFYPIFMLAGFSSFNGEW